jgi:hypothetical protein
LKRGWQILFRKARQRRHQEERVVGEIRDHFVHRLAAIEPSAAAAIAMQLSDERLSLLSTRQLESLREKLDAATELGCLERDIIDLFSPQNEAG